MATSTVGVIGYWHTHTKVPYDRSTWRTHPNNSRFLVILTFWSLASALIPDLVFLRMSNLGILTAKRIVGVPDLVIEIASPGTASYDRREKQDAYAHSGISEYWRIDPAHRTVEVLVLQDSGVYRPLALVTGKQTIPSMQIPGLTFATEDIFMPHDLERSLAPE